MRCTGGGRDESDPFGGACFMAQIFTNRMDPGCPDRKDLGEEMGWQAGEGQLCSEEQAIRVHWEGWVYAHSGTQDCR